MPVVTALSDLPARSSSTTWRQEGEHQGPQAPRLTCGPRWGARGPVRWVTACAAQERSGVMPKRASDTSTSDREWPQYRGRLVATLDSSASAHG